MPYSDEVDERSGGLLMAYTGTIRDAFFEDGKYGTQLTIEVRLDNPEDYPHIKDGIIKNWFGLGKGWVPQGNGARVVYTGEPRKDGSIPTVFNGNTLGGRLVNQMAKIDTDEKLLANGTTKEASYWKGLGHSRWDAINVPKREQQADGSYKDVPGGKDVSMPVELLDVAGTHLAEFDISSLGWDPTTLDLARKAAQSAKDYTGFVQAAVPTMPGSPALQAITTKQTGEAIFEALRLI